MLINKATITKHMNDQSINIMCFKEIGSTSDYIQTLELKSKQTLLCIAEKQTNGRGQYDRIWHSPDNQNIYLSLRKIIPISIHKLFGLSLVVGLSLCQTLEHFFPEISNQLSLKWPNDIYLDGKKLGGVLIEMIESHQNYCDVVIGIGLNVLMENDNHMRIQP